MKNISHQTVDSKAAAFNHLINTSNANDLTASDKHLQKIEKLMLEKRQKNIAIDNGFDELFVKEQYEQCRKDLENSSIVLMPIKEMNSILKRRGILI